jgi:hypothetical protein
MGVPTGSVAGEGVEILLAGVSVLTRCFSSGVLAAGVPGEGLACWAELHVNRIKMTEKPVSSFFMKTPETNCKTGKKQGQ